MYDLLKIYLNRSNGKFLMIYNSFSNSFFRNFELRSFNKLWNLFMQNTSYDIFHFHAKHKFYIILIYLIYF